MKPPTSFSGRRVLITGASGFLGTHLMRRLGATGAEIHAVSRSPRESRDPRVRWWAADFAHAAAARLVVTEVRPHVIFHLGGCVTAAPDLALVPGTFESLLSSTVHLLVAAAEVRAERVMLAASLNEPGPDQVEPVPSSPYAAAKWAASTYGRMFHALYGVPVVIVRPFMTYGPQQQRSKLVPYVALALLRREQPRLSSGDWEADWIYVEDVIDGMIAAASTPGIEGHTIDLGTGRLTSVRDVVRRLVDLAGASIETAFGAMTDLPPREPRRADSLTAARLLGWHATVDLDDGLRRTLDWCRGLRD